MKKLLFNACLINESRRTDGYLVINDGVIAEVGEGVPSSELMAACECRYDLSGMWVIPGVIDDQVHFRDPGLTWKGDMASESMAAVAGGVTSYMDMPNVNPLIEMMDMKEAQRSYEANLSMVQTARDMNSKVLDILK